MLMHNPTRGFAAIGLYHPKSPENVGSVLRAAHCYNAALVAIAGKRFKRSCTDTTSAWRHIPLLEVTSLEDAIPFATVPVAVELIPGASDLTTYVHPDRAFYIFGPEDGSLGKEVTSWCRDIVYIPTRYCMNLAATVNVVLYDRMIKRRR